MAKRPVRLGDAELEIMLAVWHSEQPVSASYVLEQLKGRRDWALSTLMTVLARLVDKGFLICEKIGRNNQYYSAVTEDAYQQSEGRSMLEKLYGNSVENLIASLYSASAIADEDLGDLRRFIDDLSAGEE